MNITLKSKVSLIAGIIILIGFMRLAWSQIPQPASSYLLVHTVQLRAGTWPMFVQPFGNDRLYVASWNERTQQKKLLILQGSNYTNVIKDIPLTDPQLSLAIDSSGSHIYATSYKNSAVSVFDTHSLNISRTISLPDGANPMELEVSRDGKTLYVGDYQKPLIYIVDLSSGKLRNQVQLSHPAFRLVLAEEANKIYVVVHDGVKSFPAEGKRIDVIDLQHSKLLHTIEIPGSGISGITLAEKRKTLFAMSSEGKVFSAIDTKSDKVVNNSDASEQRGGKSLDIVYSPSNDRLYVSIAGNGWIGEVDPVSLSFTKSVGGGGLRMAFSIADIKSVQHRLYAADAITDTITVLDLSSSNTSSGTVDGNFVLSEGDHLRFLPAARIPLPKDSGDPFDVLSVDKDHLWLSCRRPNGLLILGKNDLNKVRWIPMASEPGFLSANPKRSEIYTTSWRRPTIYALNRDDLSPSRVIHLPKDVQLIQIKIRNDGKTAFIGDIAKPIVYVFNLETEKILKEIPLSAPVSRLALAEKLNKLYVGTQARQDETNQTEKLGAIVDVIDLDKMERVESITVPGTAVAGLAVAAQKQTLFVLSERKALLTAVHTGKKHTIVKLPGTTPMPGDQSKRGSGLIYDEKADLLYAQSEGLNAAWISIVDPRTFKIVNKVMGGSGRMALQASADRKDANLYIPNSSDATLTIMNVGHR